MNNLVNSWIKPPSGGWKCRCGTPLDFPGLCDPCAERHERQGAADRIMERVATIPANFRWATFEAEELAERCKAEDIRDARKYTEDLRRGQVRNLVFIGPAGAGKTSLACAALRSLITTSVGFSARFCSAVAVARSRSDSTLGRMPEDLGDAIRASLIVLDDIGQESIRHSDVITEVVHTRHNEARPMIVTSWLGAESDGSLRPEAIAERYGDGTARRILERSAVVRVG